MRDFMLIGGLLFMVFVSSLLVVEAKHRSRSLQNELQELRVEKDRLDAEWAQLQLEESAWAGYWRIDQIAREKLQMMEPPNYVVVAVPGVGDG